MALTVIVSMPRGSFMPHLILVKHALPAIIPTLPANQWHLSEGGRAQCALLAAQQASERFARTMAEVTSQYAEQSVVVFTHGTVLTLFVARATGMEPLALWK